MKYQETKKERKVMLKPREKRTEETQVIFAISIIIYIQNTISMAVIKERSRQSYNKQTHLGMHPLHCKLPPINGNQDDVESWGDIKAIKQKLLFI